MTFPSDGGEGIDNALDVVELAHQIGCICLNRRGAHVFLVFPPLRKVFSKTFFKLASSFTRPWTASKRLK